MKLRTWITNYCLDLFQRHASFFGVVTLYEYIVKAVKTQTPYLSGVNIHSKERQDNLELNGSLQ